MKPLMITCVVVVFWCTPSHGDLSVNSRRHYALADAKDHLEYRVTAGLDVSPVRDTDTLLLEDFSAGQRYVIQRDFDIEHHRSSTEIRDPEGKRYVRVWYAISSAAKTRDELLEEFHGNPDLPALSNSLLTIETPAFTHTMREQSLSHASEREEWVSELRQTLDPQFLEGMERMRTGAIAIEDIEFFRLLFGAWFFHGNCPAVSPLHEVRDEPDSNFDNRFGFPCSAKQQERLEKARKEKRPLERY
jgi:hypothetical protein